MIYVVCKVKIPRIVSKILFKNFTRISPIFSKNFCTHSYNDSSDIKYLFMIFPIICPEIFPTPPEKLPNIYMGIGIVSSRMFILFKHFIIDFHWITTRIIVLQLFSLQKYFYSMLLDFFRRFLRKLFQGLVQKFLLGNVLEVLRRFYEELSNEFLVESKQIGCRVAGWIIGKFAAKLLEG